MQRKLKIKDLTPRKDSSFRQGYFHPTVPTKYYGDPTKIICRSGWERKFCQYCDTQESVVLWGSEPVEIPYVHPFTVDKNGRPAIKPYNVDFYMKVRTGEDTFKEYLVEVKPAKKLKAPKRPTGTITTKKLEGYNVQVKEYFTNLAKFKAAEDFAEARGWKFVVITEQFLFS